jgi:hypothetical protein
MKNIFLASVTFLLCISLSWASELSSDESESINDEIRQNEKQLGLELFINAFNTLLYGEPKEKSYKDIFVDTSKSVFFQLDSAHDMFSVDELLRVFIQTIMILVGSRRPDLIPRDFNSKSNNSFSSHTISQIIMLISI